MRKLIIIIGLAGCFAFAASTIYTLHAQEDSVLQGTVTVRDNEGRPKEDRSNVVVFLDIVEGATIPQQRTIPVMQQKGKRFVPEVLPIMVGTTVDFPNNDNIFHNVFSRSKPKRFDMGFYKGGESQSMHFDETGLVKVFCNIHSHMVGYILVLNNAFFAVTDTQGTFRISGIPKGEYKVRAWQRFGPEQSTTVTLNRPGVTTIPLELTEEKVTVKHRNKWGKEYKSSYGS